MTRAVNGKAKTRAAGARRPDQAPAGTGPADPAGTGRPGAGPPVAPTRHAWARTGAEAAGVTEIRPGDVERPPLPLSTHPPGGRRPGRR
jgi:hypothetical protein